MRLRIAMLAAALCALVAVIPAAATAAPHHNRGLTINATPNPINAGDGVLVYGQLNGSPLGGQQIILWHHLNGSGKGFTRVQSTTTNSVGFYYFARADGVVLTNREWYVTLAGDRAVHSRTIKEYVAALVSLVPSTMNGTTNHPVVFTGHVTPNHADERILLQQQNPNTGNWSTIKRDRLGPGSSYSISYDWRFPGSHDVRAVFPGDNRNIVGASDPVTITVQQTEIPDFTINSSEPVVPEGTAATISGKLYTPGSTTTGEGSTMVTLYGRTAHQSHFVALGSISTANDGSYQFAVTPAVNTVYEVRTTLAPHRHTAALLQGVKDIVVMSPSTNTTSVGQVVSFSGTVDPNKAGRWIYLERLGSDGNWHAEEAVRVSAASAFHFAWRFGQSGTFEFRARIYGDADNVGAASPPVTITVNNAPLSSLPTG
jgi:hypothetical protein